MALEHHHDIVGQIRMHWVTCGAGDPIVLLHGWPQTWYEWRHLIPVLAERHLVIAPDLRGWGETERPPGGYDVATAAADVRHLLDQLGVATAHVVGHDWGTPIGYHLAATASERVRSFTALEASIPGAGGEDLLDFSRAWNPLWFFPFLATPDLPQQLIGGGRQEVFFTWMLTQMSRATPGALTPDDIAVYVKAYSDDDDVRSSCAYYVNTWLSAQQVREAARTPLEMPVLTVAGERSLGQNMIDFVRRLAHPWPPRCELRAGRSLRSARQVSRSSGAVGGRSRLLWLLYFPAVPRSLRLGGGSVRALGIFFVFLPCLAIICFICFAAFRAQNHKVSKIFAYGCLSVGTAFATIPVGFILLWVAWALFT